MSEFTFIHKINAAQLRDYIMSHRIDQGDTIVLNHSDLEHLFQDIKTSTGETPDMPLKVLGVIITQDTTTEVPAGKVQIVKNERL